MVNAANQVPIGDCANACTLSTTPERVRKVPRIASRNDTTTSTTFHFRSIPRFSWIMIECRNAVVVSQGRKDAFSTGSHAEDDADGQEEPCDQRPAPDDGEPLGIDATGDERRDGKRERNGRRHVAE